MEYSREDFETLRFVRAFGKIQDPQKRREILELAENEGATPEDDSDDKKPILPPPPTPEEKTRFEQVADISPRAAILEKRADLEQTIRQVADPYFQKIDPESGRNRSLLESIRLLGQEGIIDDKTSAPLEDLRVIGNKAAHEPEEPAVNSKVTALRFGQLVDTVLRYVQVFL